MEGLTHNSMTIIYYMIAPSSSSIGIGIPIGGDIMMSRNNNRSTHLELPDHILEHLILIAELFFATPCGPTVLVDLVPMLGLPYAMGCKRPFGR